jgi:hypothetical protein
LDTDWSVLLLKGASMRVHDRVVVMAGIGRARASRFAIEGPAGVPAADVDESGVARFVDSLEA